MRKIFGSVLESDSNHTNREEAMTALMLRGMATDMAAYRFLDTGEEISDVDEHILSAL